MDTLQQNTFGLTERDLDTISCIFKKYPEVLTVHIFGSRAKGTYKPGSDIDLAIINDGVSDKTISRILSDLEDSTLPYYVDLVNFPTLTNQTFKDHISRVGIAFYEG